MVLDFTTSANFVARHIPGAWWLTRSQLRQALEAIPPAQRYVVTCGSSLLARYAVPEVAALPVNRCSCLPAGRWRGSPPVCRWRMATAASPSSAVTAIVVRTKEPIIPPRPCRPIWSGSMASWISWPATAPTVFGCSSASPPQASRMIHEY
ncbi:hypothetical protein UUU_22280 [Klebsiella pneumoniae subsp. pneumoniae DSM 30104 = JCM 1662 = NBRC 14940]|nr:hypothetical protein UUU_22280 [Klebsiella pneumoniae subsp. pneumoniae DSM 30104 = JCM 1662 = NBRC 14940]